LISASSATAQVYVIDDASNDGSYEKLQKLISTRRLDNVKILRNPTNLGYTGGANRGYRELESSIQYFALMNNDFILEPNALEHLVSLLEKNPRVGAIQGEILWPDGRPQICGFQLNDVLDSHPISQRGVEREVVFTSGCFSVYRMGAIRKVERDGLLFNPLIFCYCEDMVLGLKLWGAGYKCLCAALLAGYHVGSASFEGRIIFRNYLYYRAWLAWMIASNSRYRIFNLMTSGRLAIIGVMRALVKKDVREFIYFVRAWIDGLQLGSELLSSGEKIDIYAAPIQRASLLEAVFSKLLFGNSPHRSVDLP
jgi:GT2 family glycosyltransferase